MDSWNRNNCLNMINKILPNTIVFTCLYDPFYLIFHFSSVYFLHFSWRKLHVCTSGYNSIPFKTRDSWTEKWMATELQRKDRDIQWCVGGGGRRGASAKSACRPVSYFQHFDMYFPLVVYFFTQRSLFAKKDYSNTKQRAGQGATKEKSTGGVKGGG